jgi:hypothetical protein
MLPCGTGLAAKVGVEPLCDQFPRNVLAERFASSEGVAVVVAANVVPNLVPRSNGFAAKASICLADEPPRRECIHTWRQNWVRRH